MADCARILHWIGTGKNEFETDYVRHKAADSTTIGLEGDQGPFVASASESSAHHQGTELTPLGSSESENSSSHSQDELLVGCEGDPLIPTAEEIDRTYLKAQSLWRTLVEDASLFPSGCFPTSSLDPSIMLQDVPPLPQDLSGQLSIKGQSMWNVASPDIRTPAFAQKDGGNPELVYGVQKDFDLWISEPTKFGITSRDDIFRHCTSGVQPPKDAPNGLALCTICWSYIISARLLEMRKKPRKFCSTTLIPVLAKDLNSQPNDIVIDLSRASAGLVRWLCTLLAPDSRWRVQRLPPWATIYEGDYRFVVVATSLRSWDENYEPPSSGEATQLLIELGTLFGLESQITGGFLSALMLPVHNIMKLKPQLPLPRLTKAFNAPPAMSGYIRNCVSNYASNLSYYMTLSICPSSLSSAIWSVFWEPGTNCNLVSAWLGSIHHAIQPILKAGDLEMLAKVFALYRPRLAPLWLGIALLGCAEFMGMIESYLTTLEERPFFCRLSRPDPDVAAWIRSPQSFLDEAGSGCYIKDGEVLLSRSDLYRLRFNYCWLSSRFATAPFGWQPIGSVRKKDVEPELQEQLEEWRPRKYLRWIWYTREEKIEHSFCDKHQDTTETSRMLSSLDHSITEISSGTSCTIKLWPSKEATWRILVWGSRTASGDEDSIEAITKHEWLKDAR
jgi:hypothetical protein